MRTPIEDRLTESLLRNAAQVDVPAPPDLRAAAEARGVRRARTRGVVAVLGSAALVAAIVVVPQVWQRGPRETPPAVPSPARSLEDLPRGAAPKVPYLLDGKLHRGIETLATDGIHDLLSAGDTVLVLDGAGWHEVDGDEPLYLQGVDGRPELSPDGSLLVWAESAAHRTYRIHAYDMDKHREIGSVESGAALRPSINFQLLGIDPEQRVFWADPSSDEPRYRVWEPGRRRPVDAKPDDIPGAKQFTPDGEHFMIASDLPELPNATIHETNSGRATPLPLERDLGAVFAAFESDDAVLVKVGDGDQSGIVRCRIDASRCEVALEVPPEAQLQFGGEARDVPIVPHPSTAFEAASGRIYDVPALADYLPGAVAWPTAPPGHRAQLGGGDGATLFPFEKVARSTNGGKSWAVVDVQRPESVMPYLGGGAIVLPDGRLVVVVESWSDDTLERAGNRHHGLMISDGDDWSRYLPLKPSFSPALTERNGFSTIGDLAISRDGRTIRVRANERFYLSTDGGRTFHES